MEHITLYFIMENLEENELENLRRHITRIYLASQQNKSLHP